MHFRTNKRTYKKFFIGMAAAMVVTIVAIVLMLGNFSEIHVSAAEKVKLASKTAKLLIGETTKINVKNVPDGAKITYKSNKSKVATVDKNGKVDALTAGSAKIVVTVEASGKSSKLSFIVTVRKPAPKKKKLTVSEGEKLEISFKYLPVDGYDYTIDITSKKSEVVGTIDGDSKITGITPDVLKNGVLSKRFEANSVGTTVLVITINVGEKTYSTDLNIEVKAIDSSLLFALIDEVNNVSFKFKTGFYSIGRNSSCDFCINEDTIIGSKYVSRQHASIKFDDGKWYIRDDFSLNGTWLNSTQLEPGVWYSLVINDSIDIAHQTVLIFMKLSK